MDLSTLFSPSLLQNAAVLTVILAFVGYLATFISARMLARRKDKLELVNRRLNEFYGPLYVASQAGNIAYRSLLKKQGKTQSFPILDSEMKEWMLWMTTIFMPLNDVREKIIIEKAYLIVEEQMPHCLLDFVTHVVGYKAVLAKWAEGDYSERRSTIGWPPEFDIYVERSYAALKAEQTRLLHSGSLAALAPQGRAVGACVKSAPSRTWDTTNPNQLLSFRSNAGCPILSRSM
jgi:hypothetical protein